MHINFVRSTQECPHSCVTDMCIQDWEGWCYLAMRDEEDRTVLACIFLIECWQLATLKRKQKRQSTIETKRPAPQISLACTMNTQTLVCGVTYACVLLIFDLSCIYINFHFCCYILLCSLFLPQIIPPSLSPLVSLPFLPSIVELYIHEKVIVI